ncbi:MAG: S-layer homology domain-containing protein [Bacillota bacterium]|nr:S-layer homology domain-containing protein [Bacillota bacterium]
MLKNKMKKTLVKNIAIATVASSLLLSVPLISMANTPTSGTTQTTTIANTPEAQGLNDGKSAGTADGAFDGRADYLAGSKQNYKNTIMKDDQIIEKYNLNRDVATYRAYFLKSYKDAYKIAYALAFRSTNLYESTKKNTDGVEIGTALGMSAGMSAAMDDFLLRLSNNPDRAFKKFVAVQSIEKRHRIDVETKEFQQNFVSAYEKGFKEAYRMAYRQRFAKNEADNAQVYEISVAGEEVTRSWLVYDVEVKWEEADKEEDSDQKEGINENKEDKKNEKKVKLVERDNLICSITIPKGAVYVPTHINVSGEIFSFGGDSTQYYAPASSVFNVRLWNYSDYAVLRKPLKMSFNFVGAENAGIYQWRHGKWVYLPTVVTDTDISATIPEGKISNNRYAIFIDENYLPFKDTVFNWADQEISAFIRRNYLNGGGNFRPDERITRAEVAQMLYSVLGHRLPVKKTQSGIKDRNQFGAAADAIDFVVTNGIMLPHDGKFYPNAPFLYEHVEFIAPRITGDYYKWDDIASRIMQERYYRSPGYKNPKGYLTRAEMVYYLYHFIDK